MLNMKPAPRVMIEVDFYGHIHIDFRVELASGRVLPGERPPVLLLIDLEDRIIRTKYYLAKATPSTIAAMEMECNIFLREAVERLDLHYDRQACCWRYILGAPMRRPFPEEIEAIRAWRERHHR